MKQTLPCKRSIPFFPCVSSHQDGASLSCYKWPETEGRTQGSQVMTVQLKAILPAVIRNSEEVCTGKVMIYLYRCRNRLIPVIAVNSNRPVMISWKDRYPCCPIRVKCSQPLFLPPPAGLRVQYKLQLNRARIFLPEKQEL